MQSPDWYREDLVGQALSALGYNTGPLRAEVYLISKLHPRNHGFQSAIAAVERSLQHLRTDYLDLFMLHYPHCTSSLFNCTITNRTAWHGSWRALEQLQQQGKIRSIGGLCTARTQGALVWQQSEVLVHCIELANGWFISWMLAMLQSCYLAVLGAYL
jgi:aryl-alcohol dehydrogenase-like predicted oxidoreductase